MGTAELLLEQIAAAWTRETVRHRDAMLEIGRSLRAYVIAGLKERDAMRPGEAKRSKISRGRLINTAARRLKTRREKINVAIGVVAVVELLSLDGDVGEMAYEAIKMFETLIERHKGAQTQRRLAGNVTPEESESWSIKECYPQATELFRRAVIDRQSLKEIHRILFEQTKDRASPRRRLGSRTFKAGTERTEELDRAASIFRRCSARDACEQLKQMIVNSAEPLLLGSQLAAFLASRDFAAAVKERELDERISNRRTKKVV